jgi:hypothetical protein
MSPKQRALRWHATFTDLRLAGVTLAEWIAYHRARRLIVGGR